MLINIDKSILQLAKKDTNTLNSIFKNMIETYQKANKLEDIDFIIPTFKFEKFETEYMICYSDKEENIIVIDERIFNVEDFIHACIYESVRMAKDIYEHNIIKPSNLNLNLVEGEDENTQDTENLASFMFTDILCKFFTKYYMELFNQTKDKYYKFIKDNNFSKVDYMEEFFTIIEKLKSSYIKDNLEEIDLEKIGEEKLYRLIKIYTEGIISIERYINSVTSLSLNSDYMNKKISI